MAEALFRALTKASVRALVKALAEPLVSGAVLPIIIVVFVIIFVEFGVEISVFVFLGERFLNLIKQENNVLIGQQNGSVLSLSTVPSILFLFWFNAIKVVWVCDVFGIQSS